MNIYHYDPITKEYSGTTQARLDPLESIKQEREVYLIPAHSTTLPPPSTESNKVAIFINSQWTKVDKPQNNELPHVPTPEEIAAKEAERLKLEEKLKAIENLESLSTKIKSFNDVQEVIINLLKVIK